MAKSRNTPRVLSAEHYDSLSAALVRLRELDDVIPLAETCGVNCDEYKRMQEFAREAIERILSTWFPKGRPK